MRIDVTLHSYLREFLPPEAKGKTTLELPDGSSIQDAMDMLAIPNEVICAVNDRIEPDRSRALADKDHLRFLRPGAGGYSDG